VLGVTYRDRDWVVLVVDYRRGQVREQRGVTEDKVTLGYLYHKGGESLLELW
jgi:hypothetical protein